MDSSPAIIRTMFLWLTFMYLLCIPDSSAAASETTEYDYMIYEAEAQFELYHVSVNWDTKEGRFCYLNTGLSNVPDEVSIQIYDNTNRADIFDFTQYEHICSRIELYMPSGWFYTQTMDYRNYAYKFFFTGDIDKESLQGFIHIFRSNRNAPPNEKNMDEYLGDQTALHEIYGKGISKKE